MKPSPQVRRVRSRQRLAVQLAFAAALLWAFLPAPAGAQRAAASINGTVFDPSGGVVSGARVMLKNAQTGVERSTLTNQTGNYLFVDVLPGSYTLQATSPGFQTANQPEFTVYVNQTATVDFHMVLGSTQQEVTVLGAATAIESSTSELGTAVTTREVNDLPLNGRNFTQLLALTPGVSPVSVAQNSGGGGGFAGRAVGTFTFPAVNGQRNRSNIFLLDGINDLGSFIGNYNVEPILETIQEFKVQSHNDQAEFGQALGGIVNVVTKSGTNDFHGSLWEYLRNEKLDARNFFFAQRNPLRQNQFGAAGGGPVWIPHIYNGRNKTFFYAGYEGFRQSQSTESLLTTPTGAQLGGDFSGLGVQVFNPFTTRPDPNKPGSYLRDPFANNAIPSNLLDPTALLYAKTLFPPPSLGGVTGTNAVDLTPARVSQDTFSVRGDQVFGEKDALMGRFGRYTQNDTSSAGFPGAVNPVDLHGYNIALHETHTFGPSSVLDVHFGRNSGDDVITKTFQKVSQDFIGQLGMSSNFVGNFRAGNGPFVPLLSIAGFLGTGGNNVQDTVIANTWEFGGDYTKVHGRHTFKLGANFSSNNTRSPIFGASEGFSAYETANLESPQGTGNALASFLLGLPDSAGKRNVLETEHGGWIDGAYFHDQWKASDRLTVNLGLRYDVTLWPIYGDFTNQEIYVGDMNLNNGTYILAAVPPACSATQGEPCLPGGALPDHVVVTSAHNHSIYHNNYDNWQPRVGLAYRLFSKTAVRAGYGRFFDNWNSVIQLAQNYEGSWPRVGQLLANNLNHTVPDTKIQDPFKLGSSGVVIPAPTPFNQVQWFVDPYEKMPYSDQWNFGIDHQLTDNTVLSLGYVGSHSSRLNLGAYRNTAQSPGPGDAATVASRRPYPYISPTFWDQGIGRSNYNAFEFRLDHKAGHGLAYLVSYTWSKSIDIACSGSFGAEGCEVQNAYNINADRSVSGFDLTHIFSTSWVYQVPVGRGKALSSGSRAVNAIVGDWALNGILTLTSGVPYDVTVSGDIANTGNVLERANLVGNPTPASQTPNQWLNPAAFAVPPPYTFGTLGRNSLRSDWYRDLDLSLFRLFPVDEKRRFEFRAEAFNLTNTAVFSAPDHNRSDPNFGRVLGIRNTPRQVQFALKFYF